jgi:hypothetical protein
MVVEAYFDDSMVGTTNHGIGTIAGFAAMDSQWKDFSKRWKSEVLDRYGILSFHMTDCENGGRAV